MDVSQVSSINTSVNPANRVEAVQAALPVSAVRQATSDETNRNAARDETRKVAAAVHKLNEVDYSGPSRELTIRLDPKTQRPTVRIVDKKTGEVVQQIPPEYVLRMAEEARQRLKDGS